MRSTQYTETIVISLGGSLIVPDGIDTGLLQKFRDLIVSLTEKGKRFFIITGGGKVCRRYQAALAETREVTDDELDWMGIHVTRMNAELVKNVFGELAYEGVIYDPHTAAESHKPVTIGAGWKPGCSTDYDAVLMAKTVSASKLINLSNIDYVYDKDPNEHVDAEKIVSTTWSTFRDILPSEWEPGLNSPFDPVAAKEAEEFGLEVVLLNGENPDNIRRYIAGEEYVGTAISSVGL